MAEGTSAAKPDLGAFLENVLDSVGDKYEWGARAELDDPDPHAFDASELVEWAANRANAELPDGSWLQYRHIHEQGSNMSVDEALSTPGALLFTFSRDPLASEDRPSVSHVAISLGDGRVIEATTGTDRVVRVHDHDGRFTHAGAVPELADASLPDAVVADYRDRADRLQVDADSDGLPDSRDLKVGEKDANINGLTDGAEFMVDYHDLSKLDSDEDGILDIVERARGTDPNSTDTDKDGIDDHFEMMVGLDPTVANERLHLSDEGPKGPRPDDPEAAAEWDHDQALAAVSDHLIDVAMREGKTEGITEEQQARWRALQERRAEEGEPAEETEASPETPEAPPSPAPQAPEPAATEGVVGRAGRRVDRAQDQDGDGLPDRWDADDTSVDSDNDGMSDLAERQRSDAFGELVGMDTDDDGIIDAVEKRLGTDFRSADTDADGIDDHLEIAVGMDPTKADRRTGVTRSWADGARPDDPAEAAKWDVSNATAALRDHLIDVNMRAGRTEHIAEDEQARWRALQQTGNADAPGPAPEFEPGRRVDPRQDKDLDGLPDELDKDDSPVDGVSDSADYMRRAVLDQLASADSDKDGIIDVVEERMGTDPNSMDSDGDGLDDHFELTVGMDATEVDRRTGVVRRWEDGERPDDPVEAATWDQVNASAAARDHLIDLLMQSGQEAHVTPENAARWRELQKTKDSDGDGINNGTEADGRGTDPNSHDTDKDGIPDAAELQLSTLAGKVKDTDKDGLPDWAEVNVHGTNPNNPDTDNDTILDLVEVVAGTDPKTADRVPPGEPELTDPTDRTIHGADKIEDIATERDAAPAAPASEEPVPVVPPAPEPLPEPAPVEPEPLPEPAPVEPEPQADAFDTIDTSVATLEAPVDDGPIEG